ncbi:MAG TPA: hypothetical protein ENH91_06080 [Leeuwenhoekiella sp.]|nr:hypothetical protein [Leeuwenhoekiella sp.]
MVFRIKFLVVSIILFLREVSTIYAQGSQNAPPQPKNAPPPPPGLPMPIDEHIWVLLIMGLVLGVFFLRKKKTTALMP